MENAADALKMAGFLLIFIVALSISINAFGQSRQAITTILEYRDRENDYNYVEGIEERRDTKNCRCRNNSTIYV